MSVLVLSAILAADIPAAPVLALMGFAVLITIGGHIYKSKSTVATGIVILMLATAAMVVGGYLAFQAGEEDIRDDNNPREPGF
jgi:xanthosine utilization system XapX-like protein